MSVVRTSALLLCIFAASGSATSLRRLASPGAACTGKAEGDSCTFTKMDGSDMTSTCQSSKCGGVPPSMGEAGSGDMGGMTTTSCTAFPCPGSLLGDVARTTVTGTNTRDGNSFAVGENIYGPFEAGFTSRQDSNLEGLGCSDPSLGYVIGGVDTHMAEQMVAHQCSITLPRVESEAANGYVSLIDECGGHTMEYHFHERLSCLYTAEVGSKHSTKVGEAMDGKGLYGKWEDFSTSTIPLLDACGGHFGVTPDSDGVEVYHYHVQEKAPFTIGCFGPMANTDGDQTLVTLAACRGAYPDDCGDGDALDLTGAGVIGTVSYDPWCPCYDGAGSNTGTAALAAFDASNTATTTLTGTKIMDVPTGVNTDESDTKDNGATAIAMGHLAVLWVVAATATAF